MINTYSEILDRSRIRDKVGEPSEETLNTLSSDELLACIAWHFRRDYFNNGSLVNSSIADGHMLRMLKAYLEKQ